MNILSNITINNFLEKDNVSAEFLCPICFSVMFEICEFDDCGHLFCQNCIGKLDNCSLCRNKNLCYHKSKYLQRKLFDQNVLCFLSDCNQTLKLAEIEDHIVKHHTEFLLLKPESSDSKDVESFSLNPNCDDSPDMIQTSGHYLDSTNIETGHDDHNDRVHSFDSTTTYTGQDYRNYDQAVNTIQLDVGTTFCIVILVCFIMGLVIYSALRAQS